ncbi:glycosyltransferase [uncultured Bacteroides sp.]|uniref:glycosyltransferase n=1 Tax=uncultured Bacteroides sp. TaxID=162156 RepID=UPI002AA6A0A3|nr:glycosyltransferase [uncultured Bacteroides sp.]
MSRVITKRIVISVSNDLIADQRVAKVSASLHNNGYNVLLIGCIKKERKPLKRPYRTYRFNLFFKKKFIFYLEYNLRLLFVLLFKRKDILLCNDTDALPANFIASKLCRVPLVFDAHELFPEVPELVKRPQVKRVWEKIEDIIFPHLKYSYTVCESIAEHYKQKYGIKMGVVRNIPNKTDSNTPINNNQRKALETLPSLEEKKLLLYQGAVNVGRGVEWIINAMPYLDNCILCICGEGDLFHEMQALAKEKQLEKRVIFTGRLPFEELNQYTALADLGFILLENMGLSYYYSLPNRVFDYMKYGVPVLASNFPEIARIVEPNHTGKLISHYEPEYLAEVITQMLKEWEDKSTYKNRLKELADKYCWENEEKVMLEIVRKVK